MARPYLSVKDPYTDFAREFEHQLKNAGAALQDIRAKSTATIEVTKDLVEQRTLSVSARNIPTEYELTYTVTFARARAGQRTAEAANDQSVEGFQLRGAGTARQGARGRHLARGRWREIWSPSPCAAWRV